MTGPVDRECETRMTGELITYLVRYEKIEKCGLHEKCSFAGTAKVGVRNAANMMNAHMKGNDC